MYKAEFKTCDSNPNKKCHTLTEPNLGRSRKFFNIYIFAYRNFARTKHKINIPNMFKE